jgi:tetratricopeptide (TPR) repeat protein
MSSTTNPVPVERAAPDAILSSTEPSRLDRRDWLTILGLMLLTSVVFGNGLRGNFVLDDHKQIVRNDLIRLPKFWPTALTSDVWAFQGEKDTPWSNYWRPGHVGWLILNYQLFGPDPLGWHVTNLLAHLGVVACAYVLLRWLGAGWGVSSAIVAVFAIHPTRVESVTWIAGVHDVLATLYQLGALLLLTSIWRCQRGVAADPLDTTGKAFRWAGAVALYVLAVATKEIAILFPAIVALVRYTAFGDGARRDAKRALLPAIPFAGIAVVFLVARQLVLDRSVLPFPGQPGYLAVIQTLPLVIVYYLRQIVFPYWIGWSYPVRTVTAQTLGVWTFWIPLAVVTGVVVLAQRMVRGRLATIGLAVFVLTLLPALNLRALHPEQLVKDRYLYMPLLGFLMVVVPPLAAALRRAAGAAQQAALVGAHAVAVIVILLSVRTVQYNRAWRSELPLWQWAVWNDPGSATNHELLATAYMHAGPAHYPAARAEYDRALSLHAGLTDAYINRAELALREKRFDDAADDCLRVLERYPDNVRAFERLAIAREGQGRLDEAADVCRTARQRAPYRNAVFTDKLAVILVKQGKKAEALAELESVRQQAERDYSPGSRMVLFHLGVLYHESGRSGEAAPALRRFLELTEGTAEPNLVSSRQRARLLLNGMR